MTPLSRKVLRIFVSHSSKNNDFGVKLVEDLRRTLGKNDAVWYDTKGGLNGGDAWWSKIVQELEKCNIFLIVLSPEAMNSEWVIRELDTAIVGKKLIIPLLYRSCAPRIDLKAIQFISFLPPRAYEAAFKELLLTLELSSKVQKRIKVDQPEATIGAQNTKEQQWQGYEKAIADFDHVLTLDPTNAQAYNNRASCYLALKEYEKAIADYDLAIQLNTDYYSTETSSNQSLTYHALKNAYIRRASSYYALKKYEKAIADYDRAIQLSPKHIRTYNSRGIAYYDLKEYRKAIYDFDQALALQPTNAKSYLNRASAYLALKEYEKAIADYNHVIQLYPNSANAYNCRGIAYYDLKEYEKAISDFDQALALQPTNANAYQNRASAYLALSDPTLQETTLIQSSPAARHNLIINLPAKQPATVPLREREFHLLRTLLQNSEECEEKKLMKAGWGQTIDAIPNFV